MKRNLTKASTYNRKWRHAHPDKARAHWIVNAALRTGRLKKGPCEDCGSLKAHAHHADYAKPLNVTWLCTKHHEQRHHPDCAGEPYQRKPRDLWKPMPWQKSNELKALALRMAANGKSRREICETYVISKATLSKWINKPKYD